MKNLYMFMSMLAVALLVSGQAWAQCSNQLKFRYYNPDGTLSAETSLNSGQSGGSILVCSSPNGLVDVLISSTSDANLQVVRLSTASNGTTTETLVGGAIRASGNTWRLSLPLSTQTTFLLRSTALNCAGGTQFNSGFLSLQPSLSLSASVPAVCVGGSVTMTASGARGTTPSYTWFQNGVLQPETGATITRINLQTNTTFAVTATTTACGTTTQQLTVPVYGLQLSNTAATICAGSATSFTATYSGAGATFRWYALNADNTTTLLSTSAASVTTSTFTTPVLTANARYRVEATPDDCDGRVLRQDVQVTVGALTASVSPGTTLVVCPNSAVTLTASSNNPNATYQWFTVSNTSETLIAGANTAQYTYFTSSRLNEVDNLRVRVSAPNCAAQSINVTVSRANPVNSITASANTVCAGSPVTLTANSNISDATYAWYTTNAGQVLSTDKMYTPSPTVTTAYNVTITTSCGTEVAGTTIRVTPAVIVTPKSAMVFFGDAITLSASGSTSDTYVWTATIDNNVTTLGATGPTLTVTPDLGTTVYRATGAVSNGCSNTDFATVTTARAATVLPVELISFTAAWSNRYPVLIWRTASEKNSAYFAVERSFDGFTFTPVGRRAAAGNTTTLTQYEFADAELSKTGAGAVYYRLRQVDLDNSVSYSPVRTVLVPAAARSLEASLFPNPCGQDVTVRFGSLAIGQTTLVVRNLLGQPVLRHAVTTGVGPQEVQLEQVGALRAGVYYLTVEQGLQKQVLKLVHQ